MYSPKRHTTCPKKSYAQRAPIFGRKLKSLTFFTCRRWCFLRWKSASVYVIWLLFDFETQFSPFLQFRLMRHKNILIYEVLAALSNRVIAITERMFAYWRGSGASLEAKRYLKTVDQRWLNLSDESIQNSIFTGKEEGISDFSAIDCWSHLKNDCLQEGSKQIEFLQWLPSRTCCTVE